MEKKKITCPNCETELDRVMVQAIAEENLWSDKDKLYRDDVSQLDWEVYCPHCKFNLDKLLDRELEGYVPSTPEVCTEPCEMAGEKGMDCCGECVELGVKIAHQEKPNV
jgi:hypothetical protein